MTRIWTIITGTTIFFLCNAIGITNTSITFLYMWIGILLAIDTIVFFWKIFIVHKGIIKLVKSNIKDLSESRKVLDDNDYELQLILNTNGMRNAVKVQMEIAFNKYSSYLAVIILNYLLRQDAELNKSVDFTFRGSVKMFLMPNS